MPVVSLIVPVYTDFRANMKHLLQVQRVDYILYLPKLYFLGCANPLLLFAYSNFSYINKRGKCDEDLCYICKTEESWLEKNLFENCVLLTGDKNFLYIRMKKMVVITKTPAKPHLVLAYDFQTTQHQRQTMFFSQVCHFSANNLIP